MNKLYRYFGPEAEQRIKNQLEKIRQDWIDNRSCFVCKHCNDISDERNTCHLCKYTNNLVPKEFTCLLWELKGDD